MAQQESSQTVPPANYEPPALRSVGSVEELTREPQVSLVETVKG